MNKLKTTISEIDQVLKILFLHNSYGHQKSENNTSIEANSNFMI